MSDILNTIQNYLMVGGIFNPELMDHEKVRDLIIECRDKITCLQAENKLLREELEKEKSVVGYYAHVNNPEDTGSWDMRKSFVFDIIQGDDCDQAHYDIDKYQFGGKRARQRIAERKGI